MENLQTITKNVKLSRKTIFHSNGNYASALVWNIKDFTFACNLSLSLATFHDESSTLCSTFLSQNLSILDAMKYNLFPTETGIAITCFKLHFHSFIKNKKSNKNVQSSSSTYKIFLSFLFLSWTEGNEIFSTLSTFQPSSPHPFDINGFWNQKLMIVIFM